MDLQFDGTVARLLSERARIMGRPEDQIVKEAVGLSLTDPGYLAADIEDTKAIAEYELRKERGELVWVSADEARRLFELT